MMKYLKSIIIVSSIVLNANLQADIEEAKELFKDANCMSCHENGDFKHREEKVNSYPLLSRSVKSCARNNAAPWFDEDMDSVVEYLNEKHYHYKK